MEVSSRMNADINAFKKALSNIEMFNRYDADSVYVLAVSIWDCYLQLKSDDTNQQTLLASVRLFQALVPSVIPEKSISIALIPEYLLILVETEANEKVHTSIEFIAICEKHILNNFSIDKIKDIMQIVLLLLVYGLLQNLPGDDVFSLMNKCIVLDHLGNRAYTDTDLERLLNKLNRKVSSSVFSSEQELNVFNVLGNLNYRLNHYSDAIRFLCKYVDCFIQNNDRKNEKNFLNVLLVTFIYIGYCHEKINTESNLNKAISLFEALKNNTEININEYDISSLNQYKNIVQINFSRCSDHHKNEVFHGLAHFYNERAVFHSITTDSSVMQVDDQNENFNAIKRRESDIFNAHEYISMAKDCDQSNAFHSCHGLICYESTNYLQAVYIYEEALELELVKKDKDLYYEILFYLAQSKAALGDKDDALNKLKDFEDYCERKHNDDAIAHARILRIKSILSDLDLYADSNDSKYFHDLLDDILEKRLSLYVPVSVQTERRKMIFALNAFYYLRRIIEDKITFLDGIEEISYNLQKYLNAEKTLENKQRFLFKSNMLIGNLSKKSTLRQDVIYFIEFKGVELLCFGDYYSLPRGGQYSINFRGQVKKENEEIILNRIATNNRPDVILLTPSATLGAQSDRIELLTKIIATGVCVVVSTSEGEQIAHSLVATKKRINMPIYQADSIENLLKVGFCFRIYEILRYDLVTPTPLLGLAPLGDSKSFSYQAGEPTKLLAVPSLNDIHSGLKQKINNDLHTKPLGYVLQQLDKKQLALYKSARMPKDYRFMLEYYKKLVKNFENMAFLAFFPNPDSETGLFYTTPFFIQRSDVINEVRYIPPLKTNIIYSTPPTNPYRSYADDFQQCITLLNKTDFCNESECRTLLCKASITILNDQSDKTMTIISLIRHLFPVKNPSSDYECIITSVERETTDGILIAFVKSNSDGIDLHKFCRTIHKLLPVTKISDPKPKPICDPAGNINSPQTLTNMSELSLVFNMGDDIWEILKDLKNVLFKSMNDACSFATRTNTTSDAKEKNNNIAKEIQSMISIVTKEIAKENATTPSISKAFFENIRNVSINNQWGAYFTDNIKNYINDILCKYESGGQSDK